MRFVRITALALAMVLLACGCIAFIGLGRTSDTQLLGGLLVMPALMIGALRVPGGVLFKVSDGWPVLTWFGVTVVYLVPGVALGLVAARHRHMDSRGGKSA